VEPSVKMESSVKVAAPPYDPTKVAVAPPVAPVAPPVVPVAPVVKPAATQEPAAKPVPAKLATKAQDPDEVLVFVNAWVKSWSENNIPSYLGAYAPDFRTPKGEARAAWEAERKARIAKPRKIQVTLESPKVEFDENNRATVTFVQHYRSDTLKSSNAKTLVMTKVGDKWLIQQERSGG
jgi:hypothetical protein